MTKQRTSAAAIQGGFTLVELLVSIAIIGVLIALLLPAVQAARESARMTQCKNNLRQIGLSAIQFCDTNKAFPPARLRARQDGDPETNCERNQPSWLVRTLPYLEQGSQFDNWNVYSPYERHPASVRDLTTATYSCPSRRSPSESVIPSETITREISFPCGCSSTEVIDFIGGAVGDYASNHGDFTGGSIGEETDYWRGGNGTGIIISSRPKCKSKKPFDWLDKIRIKDVTDGLSQTFLAGEMHIPLSRLAQPPENGPMYNGQDLPAFARIGGPGIPISRGAQDNTLPVIGFGSWHPSVCHFVRADGSVGSIDNSIDTVVLGQLCNRSDGAAISDFN